MKRIIIIIALLIVPVNAHADEWFTWDKGNTRLHVPLTVLMLVDYGQTMWEHDNFWGTYTAEDGLEHYRYERNNILKDNPSRGEIQTYFLTSYALSTIITYALPDKYSHGFQAGIIFMEVYVVNDNYSLGIGFKF